MMDEFGAGRDDAAQPVIGISCYLEDARWGSWEMPAAVLPARYLASVAAAGAIPVLLPPVPGVEQAIGRLDGLVLAGGGDIDPSRYGAPRDPSCGPSSAARDSAELAMCNLALERRLPLLGICRGMQIMNVALGGTLHQHLPDLVGHDEHGPDPVGYGNHPVRVAPGTLLAAALRRTDLSDHLPVAAPTHHHQAVDRLGAGLTASAWASDGIIEAAELNQARHPFALAVQWHPETSDDLSLFIALAAAAARRHEAIPA
jgi:putative glutamine amidotransferase